ncbi:MAG: hypothetical protein ACRDSH_01715 [Pseudonocardiaceae bacterium]
MKRTQELSHHQPGLAPNRSQRGSRNDVTARQKTAFPHRRRRATHRFTPINLERTIMKKTIAVIGLAIGLSLAGAGIADASASAAAVPDRCMQARTALMKLQDQANAEHNPARKQALQRMVAGATLAVNSQCP